MGALLVEMLRILNESAIYLLLGFALAGLLHALLLRRQGLLRPLEGPGFRPVFLAALIGAPIPLCSCGVLPTGLTLMRRGASKGATASFLITTPETDVVSILLTFGLIGPVMAVARPIAALVTGIAAGLAINLAERRPRVTGTVSGTARGMVSEAVSDVGSETPSEIAPQARRPGGSPPGNGAPTDPCCDDCGDRSARPPAPRGWFSDAVHYGFVEFFDDLIGRLLFGLLLGAVIALLFARFDLARVAGNHVLTYLAMLLFGIPLYVCATASTPIAAGLIAAGISPGAALVFLLAGPATNLASLFVLAKPFGRLAIAVYLAMIALISVLAGIGLDLILRAGWLPAPDPSRILQPDGSMLGKIGTGVLVLLVLLSAWRRNLPAKIARGIERLTGRRVSSRGALRGLLLAAAVAWLASGLIIVGPGERAVVTRFGAISGGPRGPGLHYHWPAPFGRADRVAVGAIRRVEIGFRSGVDSTAAGLAPASQDEGKVPPGVAAVHGSPTESWMLTGDENIVDLQAVVFYQVQDRPEAVVRALYGVRDPDGLVRSAARRALQEAVASNGIDSLLTVCREDVERRARDELLQPVLDACGSGLRVVDVRLTSVHAPTPVHWAFRDVAGAAEDAAQYVNTAREYTERIVKEARGDSARAVSLARGQAVDRVARARGEASAFNELSAEYRRAPGLTRSRLHLEQLEKVLPGLRLYVDLTGTRGEGPDIWLRRGQGFETLPFGGLAAPGSSDRERKRSGEEDQ